jgi:cobalt-precorrin-5B (C1)-methyltransferase
MWQETGEEIKPLRSGLTTGSCATACCVAACRVLFADRYPESVEVSLPRGQQVDMPIKGYSQLSSIEVPEAQGIRVEIVKDAGDDPDATHGATVFVELRLIANTSSINQTTPRSNPSIVFKAASGVGTVTKTGLLLDVGEPAINPVPRSMMELHLKKYAQVYDYKGGFEVSVGVVNGENIALKTMNGRLGIVGGLSILGTTGIVRPYSCAAYIASIRQGIDVASSNGVTHIAASTGSSSEAAISAHYHLDEMALIEMGDFVGALLKHLKKGQVKKLSICGGFGKMTTLAQGDLDLNSRKSSIDFEFLQRCVAKLITSTDNHNVKNTGAQQQLLESVINANTSIEVLNLCVDAKLPLAELICQLAKEQAQQIIAKSIDVEVFAINRKGVIVAHAS